MPELICPKCQAALQEDLVESTGRADCPFCGANVSRLYSRRTVIAAEPPDFGEAPQTSEWIRLEANSDSGTTEFDPATAERILNDAGYKIGTPEPGVSRIEFSIRNFGGVRTLVLVFCGIFALIWYGMLLGMAGAVLARNDDPMFALLTVLFVAVMALAGLLPLTAALWAWRGKAALDISDTALTVRLGVRNLGISRSFPLESITRIGVMRRRGKPQPGTRGELLDRKVCVLQAGKRLLPLTIHPDARVSGAMTAFVRHQLSARGHVVPHE